MTSLKDKLKASTYLGTTLTLMALTSACSDSGGSNASLVEIEENATLSGFVIDYATGDAIEGATINLSIDQGSSLKSVATTTTQADGAYQITGIGVANRFVLTADDGVSVKFIETFSNNHDYPNVSISPRMIDKGSPAMELPFTDNASIQATLLEPLTMLYAIPDEVYASSVGRITPLSLYGALNLDNQSASIGATTINIPLTQGLQSENAPNSLSLYRLDESTGYWVEESSAVLLEVETFIDVSKVVEVEVQVAVETEDGTTPQFKTEIQQQTVIEPVKQLSYFYQGVVSRSGTWAVGETFDTVDVTGCVEDKDEKSVRNLPVKATGIGFSPVNNGYIGTHMGYTNSEGQFTLRVKAESRVIVGSNDLIADQLNSLESGDKFDDCLLHVPGASEITLTWGELPVDLDGTLYGPRKPSEFQTIEEAGEERYVYYGGQTKKVDDIRFHMDIGDTESFGPERIKIERFELAGTYRYIVEYREDSFRDKYLAEQQDGTYRETDATMQTHPARVEFEFAGRVFVFSTTNAEIIPLPAPKDDKDAEKLAKLNPLDYWHVFNVVVSEVAIVEGETDADSITLPADAIATLSETYENEDGEQIARKTSIVPVQAFHAYSEAPKVSSGDSSGSGGDSGGEEF